MALTAVETDTVRRATFSDLKAIIDINDNVYDGLDYLPAMFYVFMQSKRHAIYVYERNGKLLGLENLKFHPKEEDLASAMSRRVHSSVQGQGISRDGGPIQQRIAKDFPNIKRNVGDSLLKPNILAKLHEFRPLLIRNCVYYKPPDRQSLKSFAQARPNQPPKPIRLSYSAAVEWLHAGSRQLESFLARYSTEFVSAFNNWEPVRIGEFGLKYLFSNSHSFVSFGERYGGAKSDQTKSPSIVVIPEDEEEAAAVAAAGELFRPAAADDGVASFIRKAREYGIAGLSYSSGISTKYGLRVDIYFYGDSEDLLVNHLRRHVEHYLDVTTDQVKIGFDLHFPLTVSSENVQSRLREEWGERLITADINASQAVLYINNVMPSKL